ncbi:hypothetical protein B0G80_2115 [Paraburkholderia sp. BL6669N2]|uniref:hypothetical protein n=1 Tax=Paraburkholderia sp. BL6669N2 TaxID=1938807 RepID=UPI000E3A03AB|nr:hypothetical protein [Paraburkholderia sp. BL6669N2]REG59368.1 hypothetical protein B0G80_2115 [Paraburkholderia sp. BL6669N2]
MKVRDILRRLHEADPEAVVLYLAPYADDGTKLPTSNRASKWPSCRQFSELDTTDSGWDISMRRIDAEYDLPQFQASTLVRKIAANSFRLPTADRARFQQLPDHLIERIEQIVRDAYIEAGEDVGGDISSEDVWQQALTARRDMVANGDLISEAEFRRRGSLSTRRLSELLADESVFKLEVDGVEYFPAVLAVPANQRRNLYAICHVLATAPTDARLDFLTSPRESLADHSPLEALKNDKNRFKTVSRMAMAWASEWSRTSVKIYDGNHETEPPGVEPLYTAAVEIDPRKPLWTRASEALHVHGYEWPLGPYPEPRIFTVFVERQAVGDSTPIPEACVQVLVVGELVRIRIVAAPGTALNSQTIAAGKHKTVVDVAK